MAILWLIDVDKNDVPLVGGKAANLGELLRVEIPVPDGFVVDARTFRDFIERSRIKDKIYDILNKINIENSNELEEASKTIREIIVSSEIPNEIEEEIIKAYRKLCEEEGGEVYVAIRSSATAEDLPGASFAGQQETYLNVKGEKNVVEKVKECWSSLFTPRAIYYRVQKGFRHEDVSIAVVVQKMVNSEKSGVMFTSHPVTGEKKCIIEAVFGLGEAIVSGSVTPDTYIYDRRSKKLIDVKIGEKKFMIVRKDGENTKVELDEKTMKKRVLSDQEIEKLVSIGELIEE
ncbi:phosphoenolpyruvate synthase, partial [Archaeoglobales archaeon ex4484_92]